MLKTIKEIKMRYTYKGNSIYKDGNRLGAKKKAYVIQIDKMNYLRLERTISFCRKYGRYISDITFMEPPSNIPAEFNKLYKDMKKQMLATCGSSISKRTSENQRKLDDGVDALKLSLIQKRQVISEDVPHSDLTENKPNVIDELDIHLKSQEENNISKTSEVLQDKLRGVTAHTIIIDDCAYINTKDKG